jgi:hypothetical protein
LRSDRMAEKSSGAAGSKKKGPNKMEAVRTALRKLGNEATPIKIQEFLKTELKIGMTTEHISNYKSDILKKARATGSRPSPLAQPGTVAAATVKPAPAAAPKAPLKAAAKPAAKAAAPKPAAKPVTPVTATAGRAAVSLEDIRAVKGLVGRVGSTHLKSLIDVLN